MIQKPEISLVAALSLSGHIAGFRPSVEDRAHLEALRDKTKASLMGAGTLRKENPEMRGSCGKLHENRIRALISLSGDIPFEGKKIFEIGPPPLVFTAKEQAKFLQKKAGARAEILGLDFLEKTLDLRQAVEILKKRGGDSILIEGGGGLNFHALEQKIVGNLYLTLCPEIVNDPNAEFFLRQDGSLGNKTDWNLVDFREGSFSEIFLHYRTISNPR